MTKALEAARAAARARREAGEEIERLNPLEKAARNPHSLRLAVNGKCFDCVGRDGDPNWRGRVRDCTVARCTLYPVRPFQRELDEADLQSLAEVP